MSIGVYTHPEHPGQYFEPRDKKLVQGIPRGKFEDFNYLGLDGTRTWENAGFDGARYKDINAAIGRFVRAFQDASLVPQANLTHISSLHPDDARLADAMGVDARLPDRITTLPPAHTVTVYRQQMGGLVRDLLELRGVQPEHIPLAFDAIPCPPNDRPFSADAPISTAGQSFHLDSVESILAAAGSTVLPCMENIAQAVTEDFASRATLSTPSTRSDVSWLRENLGDQSGVCYSTLHPKDLMRTASQFVVHMPLMALSLDTEDRRRYAPWLLPKA